jgi:hypothetical protein
MGNRGMIEASYNVHNSIDFSNMAQELVAKTFSFACAFDEASDVKEFHGGRGNFGRFDDFSNSLQPFIRNLYNPYIGIDSAEGIIGHFGARGCQGVENGGFPNIRKPDNTALEAHSILLY